MSADPRSWRNAAMVRSVADVSIALAVAAAASAAILLVLLNTGRAAAQPVDIPATWGGDFWSRPRLTGSWGGFRDEMGKKGVVLDVDLLAIPQGVVDGGAHEDAGLWGTAEYTLNVDTGKAGLWPGGFFRVYAMSGFGESVNKDAGALIPPNFAAFVPDHGEDATVLMNLTFMQFFSTKFGVVLGKLNTLEGDANAFAHGFRSNFLNTALGINTALALFPFSAYGGSLIILPWDGAIVTLGVVDPSGTPKNNDISEAFEDGVLLSAEARVTIKPFGLLGHQLVGFGWSNKNHLSIDQDPANIARALAFERFPRLQDPGPVLRRIIERFFPGLLAAAQPADRKDETWSAYYNFDQYLWHPGGDQTRGLGIFFRFGVSDGNPNPIKYAYNVGVSGNGIVPGRPRDSFGIGWARTEFSNELLPFLRRTLGLGLDREDAVELYYNFAITPALNATLDLQIIDPGLKKKLNDSGTRLESVDTAIVAGLRVYARF
jgi:porin